MQKRMKERKLRTLLDADALVDHALGESGLALLVRDCANVAEDLRGSGQVRFWSNKPKRRTSFG